MKQIFAVIFKKRELNALATWILLVAAAMATTALALIIQPVGLSYVLECVRESGFLTFAVNLAPVLLCSIFLFFALGNMPAAAGTTAFAVTLLSLANRYKIGMRSDPFRPWDVLLGGEVAGVAKSFEPRVVIITATALLCVAAATAAAVFLLKSPKLRLLVRVSGALLTLCAAFAVNASLLSSKSVYDSLYLIGSPYNQLDQFNSKGFLYSFIYEFNAGKIVKPDNYDTERVARLNTDGKPAPDGLKAPHVLLILGEAFSEIPANPGIIYDSGEPLANYNRMKSEGLSGGLIVPDVGGGTANTEFDILTGVSTRNYRGMSYSNMLVTKEIPALPWALARIGYKTVSIHPGQPWFYNRMNVFPLLGFESFKDRDYFENDVKGMYVSDKAAYDKLIEDFRERLAGGGAPLFEFLITIQNHGPYAGKYGDAAPLNFATDLALGESDLDALANYIYGVKDADENLGRLADEARASEEPVVIVFFGDHMPSFPQAAYNALIPDSGESGPGNLLRLNRAPFLVWANDAAKPLVRQDALKNGEIMSSFYFGAALLDYLGLSEYSDSFWSYLNEQRADAPVITEKEYFTGDGVRHDKEAEPSDSVNRYEQWAYFRIFG